MSAKEIEGFDPLSENVAMGTIEAALLQQATKGLVLNILKSYTGYFDLFSELIQNSLDAIDLRAKDDASYSPRLHVRIDIERNSVSVFDNGSGMNLDQFKYCFRPSVSFKTRREGRGHKGVGATFIAYNYDFVRLETKQRNFHISGILKQGRLWAEDVSNTVPRPLFSHSDTLSPELKAETSGTIFEIHIGQSQRPQLTWWNATNAKQWFELLLMRTPLGGLYLTTPERRKQLEGRITVRDNTGSETVHTFSHAEYLYPHELENLDKVKSIGEIDRRMSELTGDPGQRLEKIGDAFKRLSAVYEIWDNQQILSNETLTRNLDESQRELIGRHKVTLYGCFVSSAKSWSDFQENILKIRKSPLVLKGGLQLASDFMVQGDLSVIPLTSTIGYQNNTHIVVHMIDGNPDMGRKVFQPEIKAVTEELSRRAVDIFKRYLTLMREDTGIPPPRTTRQLETWRNQQEQYRREHPLLSPNADIHLPLVSEPQAEQDVVSLFHELLGCKILRGYNIFATSEYQTYDCVFTVKYEATDGYSKDGNVLGVAHNVIISEESWPQILEYKFDLDGLVADIESELKFTRDINLCVCWSIGNEYKDSFSIRSYLVGDEGSTRQTFGATHALLKERETVMEIICLKDLISYLRDKVSEEGAQRARYV